MGPIEHTPPTEVSRPKRMTNIPLPIVSFNEISIGTVYKARYGTYPNLSYRSHLSLIKIISIVLNSSTYSTKSAIDHICLHMSCTVRLISTTVRLFPTTVRIIHTTVRLIHTTLQVIHCAVRLIHCAVR